MTDALVFTGQEHEITLPTGRVITLRETNGDDDELLSRLKDAKSGDSVFNFLANITNMDSIVKKKPLVSDLMGWPVSDRYYALFKQRVINQGPLLKFDFICQTPDCPTQRDGEKAQEFEYDLNEFDGDLSNSEYKPSLITQVKKYPLGSTKQIEFETSSKKKLRYKILDGILEKKTLDEPADNRHKNSHLYLRELEIFSGGSWILLTHFKMFPSREMSEIRRHVDDHDPFFQPSVKFTCPTCKTPYSIPLFDIPVFYWPEERI